MDDFSENRSPVALVTVTLVTLHTCPRAGPAWTPVCTDPCHTLAPSRKRTLITHQAAKFY